MGDVVDSVDFRWIQLGGVSDWWIRLVDPPLRNWPSEGSWWTPVRLTPVRSDLWWILVDPSFKNPLGIGILVDLGGS